MDGLLQACLAEERMMSGRWLAQVETVQQMSAEDRRLNLSDSLPPGLALVG